MEGAPGGRQVGVDEGPWEPAAPAGGGSTPGEKAKMMAWVSLIFVGGQDIGFDG